MAENFIMNYQSEAVIAKRKEKDRLRKASARSKETQEVADMRKKQDRLRQASVRSDVPDDLVMIRKEQNRLRTASVGSNLPNGLTETRKEQNRIRTASVRTDESDDLAEILKEQDRLRTDSVRACESEADQKVHSKHRYVWYTANKELRCKRYLNFARSQNTSEVSDDTVTKHSLGTMSYSCSLCDAKFWESEKLSTSTKANIKLYLCCGEGKVLLSPLGTPPDLLTKLLTASDTRGKEFRKHIRAYNSSLALCSLGANYDKELATAKHGVYPFRIHGVVHHLIGSLVPRDGKVAAFSQIYIHDGTPEAELEIRQQHLGQAYLPELLGLQNMLHEVNPHVGNFEHAMQLIRATGVLEVRMIIKADACPDPRRYSAPTASEIAVLLPGDGYSEGVMHRDIVLHAHSGDLKRITETHCSYDSLHYVLLFPLGDDGWHIHVPHNRGKSNVTALEYYCYRLMIRGGINHLHLSGRLFHQYIVDMYAKIEQLRLIYIKTNQQNIRVDLYSGLVDALAKGETNPSELGRKVILPSSYTRS